MLDQKYFIHSGVDGLLDLGGVRSSSDDIIRLVAELPPQGHVALTIHGGLVSFGAGIETAEKLLPLYLRHGVHPIFIVWETGPLETLQNLLRRVWGEPFFQILVKKLLQHVATKIAGEVITGGRDARGLPNLVDDTRTTREFLKARRQELPFGDIQPTGKVAPLTADEVDRFQVALAHGSDFHREAEAAARWLENAENSPLANARAAQGVGAGTPTLANPELFKSDAGDGRRFGVFTSAKLIAAAVRVFLRIISRYSARRDHGLYATVVEETLREFYATNIGAAVWTTMKRQAEMAFADPGIPPMRAGWRLVEELAKRFSGDPGFKAELSVVGHSAGSIYACHLLKHAHSLRGRQLPSEFAFKNLLLLAPAVTFDAFNEVRSLTGSPIFRNFRLYALRDELERGYWEAGIFPASLLYLVAGALELEADGQTTASDAPLLGMERYHTMTDVYRTRSILEIRQFLKDRAALPRQVWSATDDGPGRMCDSAKHGEFFLNVDSEPAKVMHSVLEAIALSV